MRLVSWNILAGGGSRCGAIVTRLERCDADIIVLQETMTTRASDLCHALGRASYAHRFSAPRSPRGRGLCVPSRLPLRRTAGPAPLHAGIYPGGWLAGIGLVDLWRREHGDTREHTWFSHPGRAARAAGSASIMRLPLRGSPTA